MPDKKHQTPWGFLLMLFLPGLNLLGVPILVLRFAFRDFKTLRRGIDEEARRFGRQQMTLLSIAVILLLTEVAVIGSSMRSLALTSRRDLLTARAQQVCEKVQESSWCQEGRGLVPTRFRPDPGFPFEDALSYDLLSDQKGNLVLTVSSEKKQLLEEPIQVDCPCTSP